MQVCEAHFEVQWPSWLPGYASGDEDCFTRFGHKEQVNAFWGPQKKALKQISRVAVSCTE